jgi:hypothetical protein
VQLIKVVLEAIPAYALNHFYPALLKHKVVPVLQVTEPQIVGGIRFHNSHLKITLIDSIIATM